MPQVLAATRTTFGDHVCGYMRDDGVESGDKFEW